MNSSPAGANAFPCVYCGGSDIRRSRRQGWLEWVKMAIGVYPFRCLTCGARFSGNIWMHSSMGEAKCPRCLRFDLVASPARAHRHSRWQSALIALGAHQYRCTPCRLNFVSFRRRRGASAPRPQEDLADDRSSGDLQTR